MGRSKKTAKKMKNTLWRKTKQKNRNVQKRRNATESIAIGHVRDANSRKIFKNATLCAQFLRDYSDSPMLKDIQPEDIQDVTERYHAYLGIHFEGDTVKRIKLHDVEFPELFVISVIEHKSSVDYNVSMQLFNYMVCIWKEYAREMEEKRPGITRTRDFRYPPILPIVYYEGSAEWTADLNFRDRIHLKDVFGDYCPNFTYKVVRIHDYTNEELLDREDEMSFLMVINRIQSTKDLSEFLQVEQETVRRIVDKASPQVLEIFAETIWSLCMKMNVPLEEAEKCVNKVKERNMGYLFENMEKMDIQEERRKTADARRKLQEERKKAQSQIEELQGRIEEAQKKARDEAIANTVKLCRKFHASREAAAQELMSAYGMDQKTAQKMVDLYWKVTES